jgi:hypothetical protein
MTTSTAQQLQQYFSTEKQRGFETNFLLVADDLQHGCRLLPPARQGAAVDQAGGYAAGVTGSTIHNFRSYLCN